MVTRTSDKRSALVACTTGVKLAAISYPVSVAIWATVPPGYTTVEVGIGRGRLDYFDLLELVE